jgi:hypothetical protein
VVAKGQIDKCCSVLSLVAISSGKARRRKSVSLSARDYVDRQLSLKFFCFYLSSTVRGTMARPHARTREWKVFRGFALLGRLSFQSILCFDRLTIHRDVRDVEERSHNEGGHRFLHEGVTCERLRTCIENHPN